MSARISISALLGFLLVAVGSVAQANAQTEENKAQYLQDLDEATIRRSAREDTNYPIAKLADSGVDVKGYRDRLVAKRNAEGLSAEERDALIALEKWRVANE